MYINKDDQKYYGDLVKKLHTVHGYSDEELKDLLDYFSHLVSMTDCLPLEFSLFKHRLRLDLEMLERFKFERNIS